MKKKILNTVLGTLLGTLLFGMTAFAAEFTVTPANAVLYTTAGADLLSDADTNAVALLDMPAGLPFQVTGITSNGYFQVNLNGQTFYIIGGELVQDANAAATTTAPAQTTATTTNADGTVPVKDANGNYVCVIGADNDLSIFRSYFYRGAQYNYLRQDFTKHPVYIAFRDALESQIASGKTCIEASWTGLLTDGNRADDIADNVIVDIYKSHPQYAYGNDYVDFDTSLYDGVTTAFHGEREATYSIMMEIPSTVEE